MELLADPGLLGLGNRLKRLSDRMMQDGIRIYRETGLDFEPRWFPVYYYLARRGPTPLTLIARGLGVTHPGVNQVAKEMIDAGLLAAYRDPADKRKRVLALTKAGKSLLPALEAVWADVRAACLALIDEAGAELPGQLAALEGALANRGLYERFQARQKPVTPGYEVVAFQPDYAAAFRRLSEAWIQAYFSLEPADEVLFADPESSIIAPGGDILFIRRVQDGQLVGTCALLNRGQGRAELAKMGVEEACRGQGLGKLLAFAVINRARELRFKQLCLESNARLAPAMALYRQLGFVERAAPEASAYSRVDIYMEMAL
ncbi:MAG: GNAT family N-acetyltransferase [Pseudomonadota bacterium]